MISNSACYVYGLCMILSVKGIISLNTVTKMVCNGDGCVLFEVRTELLHIM
jgi:hypothetical protein